MVRLSVVEVGQRITPLSPLTPPPPPHLLLRPLSQQLMWEEYNEQKVCTDFNACVCHHYCMAVS